MRYCELSCKVWLKQDISFKESFEILSKYISFAMYEDGASNVHEKEGFKYYTFGGLLPLEKEQIYKKDHFYHFTIRSLDETLIDALKTKLRTNINNTHFLVIEAHKKILSEFFITELYSATPVVVSVDNGKYWTMNESGDIAQLQKQLHENAVQKYQSFFNTTLDVTQNFIQLIEIKNRSPQNIHITKNGKPIRFFGNKFRIIPNEDEISQKLACVAIACGIGEKNSYGAGFLLAKGMR